MKVVFLCGLVRVKSDSIPRKYKTNLRGKQGTKIPTFRKRNFRGFKRCRQLLLNARLCCVTIKKSLNADKTPGHVGGQPVLSDEMEMLLVKWLITCSWHEYPLDAHDTHRVVKAHFDATEQKFLKFRSYFPGRYFLCNILKCHKSLI
jgi:hypothetical protein